MNSFAIINKNNPELFWSNTDGWVDDDNFDVFTAYEADYLTLPIEGEWIRLNLGVV
jgi:hypothetical protein